VSEATVYRLLKDHGLITSRGRHLIEGGRSLRQSDDCHNQLGATDFTSSSHSAGAGSNLSTVLVTSRSTPGLDCAPPCRQPTCPYVALWRCGSLNQVKFCIGHGC